MDTTFISNMPINQDFSFWRDFAPLLVSTILVVGGWLFNQHIERKRKTRDIRVEYLIKAYNALLPFTREKVWMNDGEKERAVAVLNEIYIFGRKHYIKKMISIKTAFDKTIFIDLVFEVANEIRVDLGLGKLERGLELPFFTNSVPNNKPM